MPRRATLKNLAEIESNIIEKAFKTNQNAKKKGRVVIMILK